MKILHINNFFCKHGGAENSMYREAVLLRENGHEVFFFATDRQPFLEKDYKYAGYFPKSVPYYSLSKIKALKYIFKLFYNFEAEHKLDLFLKEIKPDIVHCHCIPYNLTPAILRACYKNNIPVVMALRSARIMCPSGTLRLKDEYYCKNELCVSGNPLHCLFNKCESKSLARSIIVTTEYLFRKIHKLYDKVSYFVCISEAILELAYRSGIKREKLVLIKNCIDDSYFKIQPEYANKGYFLFVGRLTRDKGVNYLLEAMKKLPDIELHIAGIGDEEKNLKKQAEKLNLSNVKFLGFKLGKELEQEYRNCIATILPCNWFEAFGLTIIESFAYGKPVIASDVGGIPEIIENGKNGITFEIGNIDKLANAIKKLYLNNDLAVEMGKNGNAKAKTMYNVQDHYNKLIEVYNSLVYAK
ncbi:MAG: glycosyltransferase family 4 protein [bacterium]